MSSDLDEIRALLCAQFSIFDPVAFRDLIAEGVVWAPPHGEARIGAGALVAWLEPFFEQFDYELKLRPNSVTCGPSAAFEIGAVSTRLRPKGAGAFQENESRYLAVWRGAGDGDGGWRLSVFADLAHGAPGRG